MSSASPRVLSPYEKTHLARHGLSGIDISKYGEMPVEYITGHVDFMGRDFIVTKDVLIPRIETEGLVNIALVEAERLAAGRAEAGRTEPLIIADVGTGSGAIAVTLSQELEKRHIPHLLYASEISPAALKIAQENAELLLGENSEKRLVFLESDLLSSYPQKLQFDLIATNLPYIPSARIAFLEESVRGYEPYLALDGGNDGLKYIRELLKQAGGKLRPEGVILMEVDYTHTYDAWREWVEGWQIELKRDEFAKNRMARVTLALPG